jgi:putative flippase GtrA
VLALATASDQHDAARVAAHLGLFDRVFASDGSTNLKSRRKAVALTAAFPGGFVYAGNESPDLAVWAAAAGAVVANAPRNVMRQAEARFAVEKIFPRQAGVAYSFWASLVAHPEVRQFLRFLAVGATCTGLQYVILVLLVEIAKQPKFWSAAAAYLCGLIASYLLNRAFTFAGTQTHFGKTFAKFVLLGVSGLTLNMAIFTALTYVGFYYLLAQVIATGLVLIWNYAWSKLVVFR